MENFYFTFGSWERYPYGRGQVVKVIAPSRAWAVKRYRESHPDINKGVVNCADIYTEKEFLSSVMADDEIVEVLN